MISTDAFATQCRYHQSGSIFHGLLSSYHCSTTYIRYPSSSVSSSRMPKPQWLATSSAFFRSENTNFFRSDIESWFSDQKKKERVEAGKWKCWNDVRRRSLNKIMLVSPPPVGQIMEWWYCWSLRKVRSMKYKLIIGMNYVSKYVLYNRIRNDGPKRPAVLSMGKKHTLVPYTFPTTIISHSLTRFCKNQFTDYSLLV